MDALNDAQRVTADQINLEFNFHPANDLTGAAHAEVRAVLREAAHKINELLPECTTKYSALLKLREAMWAANSAVACYGQLDREWQQRTRDRVGESWHTPEKAPAVAPAPLAD